MEIALLYVAGAVLLGLAGVGVGGGGLVDAIPIIGVAIALYIMFAVVGA